jgi:hypothetical protein
MCPAKAKRLIDNLTKGLFAPDVDALRAFFAQDVKGTQCHVTPTLAHQQQPTINRLLNAGLIETSSVSSAKTPELRPTFITPRGQKLLDSMNSGLNAILRN